MRLAAPLPAPASDPAAWIAALRSKGYRTSYCPIGIDSSPAQRVEYREAAHEADVVISEVGAWSNPLSPDRATADAAYRKMVESLRLADDIGARCCVNIVGSCGESWDGPDARDLTEETFDRIVDLWTRILDEAQPRETRLTVEAMPWMYPDSPESYARLLDAIGRDEVAVHYDPVNLVNSPQKYFRNGDEIDRFVDMLGPKIVSVHAKDIVLGTSLTTHLDECIPGTGGLDYERLLGRLSGLDPDLPVMAEHLPGEAEYDQAVSYIRSVARKLGVTV